MTSKYAWCILKDHINDHRYEGTFGPHNFAPSFSTALLMGQGRRFRLLDADREVYYEGQIVGDYAGFEPLDDFGTPNDGCTIIQYLKDGKWVDL